MYRLSVNEQTTDRSSAIGESYGNAILRTFSSFQAPSQRQHPRSHSHTTAISPAVVNEFSLHSSYRRSSFLSSVPTSFLSFFLLLLLVITCQLNRGVHRQLVNGSSDHQPSLADPSSLSSSSSSLLSSSACEPTGNCFTIEAHLPLDKTKLQKFQRLLTRLDYAYNTPSMATTALPPPTTIKDRYLFRSLSNENQQASTRKSKYTSNRNPTSSGTPPSLRKRYKFSSTPTEQNTPSNVYKFPPTEQRSQSTGSDRYYFPPDESTAKPEQTLTYVRSGSGLEQRAVTFIDGTSATPEKRLSPAKTITPDTPYLFSKSPESARQEDTWLEQRQQPYVIFDSITDASPASQFKRPRSTSASPDRNQSKRSPSRMDTVTSTNGSLSTIRRSSPTKPQNVRFDPSATQRSYLSEARERLAGKQRGRSPQAFQQSVDRLASTTTQKYLQQQILSPPLPFQPPQHHHYVSQYYAQEEDEPPVDYPMDSDDEEPVKRAHLYNRGLNTNRTHTQIMKNVNKSLIDRNYLAETNRSRQLEQNVHRYLRFIENQALQRELNHDLIRCFSSTYLDDLRREENRHTQTRANLRSYTFEDIQDIHMSAALESYKMKKAIDRERRVRLSTSFDGQMTSSTPTSSIGAGQLSPSLSPYSPMMTSSFNENVDVHSGGFEIDRRAQKPQPSTSQTPTGLRPGHATPGPDLFYEIMQDRFRGVDASIAGQVSHASQYQKPKDPPSTIATKKPTDHDSDLDTRSYSSLWSDDDDEQMIVDKHDQTIPHQKQLARYLSTVNRSLLDRPSDLVADFYISKLNQGMQESVRHVENIARDKALMRQNRNREFIDESTSKLGRSLSAEHLYQVRKEHLRYKQSSNTPTSFTVEDVEDIYKPFVLENYKRKIAIELERRRRERQGQLMAGITSPSTYASETDSFNAIKSTQPPVIEVPLHVRPANLERTRIVRTNDYDQRASDIIVPRPVVQTRAVPVGQARRTLTDDGSGDVVHHVGIIAPPLSYSVVKRPSLQKRTTVSTSTADRSEVPQVSTVFPPDFVDRREVHLRQQRIQLEIAQPPAEELIDGPLTSTQQVLIQDVDRDPTLRRPVQIITSIQSELTTNRRPPAQIYTSSPQSDSVRVCHADCVETDSGNYDLNMVDIRPIVTLNQGEIRQLNFIAHEAQRLHIASQDFDHAMIMLSPERTQYQHQIHRQPLLLAAANVDLISDEHNEQVTRHTDLHVQPQRTNLILPIAEHMAKVEQDIPVFENLASANIVQPSRNKLQEVPHDSGIVSLNTSQASEQPLIFNASHTQRLEPSDEQRLENLHEDDYYRRRIRALDLLRHVETDPNAHIQPVHHQPMEIFENTTKIPSPRVQREHTNRIDEHRFDQMQTLEHTDEPIVYESIEPNAIQRIPAREQLVSSDILQDQQTTHRAEENPVQWGEMRAPPQHHSTESQLPDVQYEQLQPFSPSASEQRDTLRISQEPTHVFETPQRPSSNVVYNYGDEQETTLHRASSINSPKDLQTARVEYDRHSLSSLDDITQPISHHPPIQTSRDQQHTAVELDVEAMAVREETALENEVSYDGSFGRASFTRPVQPFHAPRTLAHADMQPVLLEDLTPVVHEQRATRITDSANQGNLLERFEESNRVPIVVYDTDWSEEKSQPLASELLSSLQNARWKSPEQVEYQQAKVVSPSPVLSRERYEQIESDRQEITEQIPGDTMQTDRLIERVESESNLIPQSKQSSKEILCQPIAEQLQTNDEEEMSSISDDSLLIRHQQQSNVHLNENLPLENPLRSTAFLTLNYAQHNEEANPSWQRSSDQQFNHSIPSLEQHTQIHQEQLSPHHLPSIASVENYLSEFHQSPLLHENVRIEDAEPIPLLPAAQVHQTQPVSRVRQQISPDSTPTPVLVNIDVRVRPTHSETSSLTDTDSILNPLETHIESEQHLPLVDQISLSYTTSIRTLQDDTERAIERYEQEHPFFSRSLPREWLEQTVLPHDEQLVEQWIVERNLHTIQQQVELTDTKPPCDSVIKPAAALANDACARGERFEEEREPPVLVSHCSPTSDYETDSLEKENETSSTSAVPVQAGEASATVPVNFFLETLANEERSRNDVTKEFLLTIGFGKSKETIHRAREDHLEEDEDFVLFNFDEDLHQFPNLFFEPAHFQLPLINELSIYQFTFHQEYARLPPLNLFQTLIPPHEHLASNHYRIHHQEILSIGQINEQSDLEEDLESLSSSSERALHVDNYQSESLQALYAHVTEPAVIRENEEYLEHGSREVIPSSTDTSPIQPFNRTEQARQSTESYHLERLPAQHIVELKLSTPTSSIRAVRPAQPGTYTEDLIMDTTTHARTESPPRPSRPHQSDLKYASTISREQPEHLPPRHLPVDYTSDRERARVVSNTDVSLSKNEEVLIRDTVVQHISEDEKSTSSEEVVFEEWSEEFRCRRTEEYDQKTNQLLRTTIDETSARVKSDVIKEEYKEKNERIKGHKSYDVVKEVYRRVPARPVEPLQSHLYEEIPQPPPSTISPRDRHWSSEDIYTTEIVYDTKLAHDIESSAHAQRTDTRFDSSSPPSSAANYDRVRPGQYPIMPSTSQATVSTVPSSNYDRISSIVTPSTHVADRRQADREEYVSEEYHVEVEHHQTDRRSPSAQRPISTKQQRDETSEEEVSDLADRGQRRDSDWRNRLRQVYAPSSDEDRFDQFAKATNPTAQRVTILPSNLRQLSPGPSRRAVKEILVCVTRGPSPEKQLQQTIYQLTSSSSEEESGRGRGDSSRARDVTKRVTSTTRTEEDRPQPPKRSASSSSFIDERRSKFEQQSGSTSPFSTNVTDRPSAGRVGELKTAFESTSTINLRDDATRYKSPVSTGLTDQRRRIFEEQEQFNRRSKQSPPRRVHRISARHRTSPSLEFNPNERRMSETHTAPSRVQPTDRLGRTGFDAIKSSLESSMAKPAETTSPPQVSSTTERVKDKRTISSIDSDLSGSPPPIYQSTPKSTKQKHEEDPGEESEDELTDPARKEDQSFEARRRASKTRLRDFSQSTSQPIDASYLSQRTKSSFNETNMENILSHVPTSKGKGLLIELSPHLSHETPITITTKPITASDSGIFEYSTATSLHPPTTSSSWRHNASSSILDDGHRTPTTRDSGVYLDSAGSGSSRYARRLPSDTDQTTIHGGDESVSRSTFKYDTEIISSDQLTQPAQTRNIRRQITGSPPSDYENIANYHSGLTSQRKVPITTQSRSILPKALIVDEIETIETETHVECQVQRTHEIKESTKTERASSPGAPKRVVTTTTTTTTTTAVPDEHSRPTHHQPRFDSPQSDSVSYPSQIREHDLIRVEETGFKPIQSPTSRSSTRALSAGPRSVEVTSLSPQNQVTFGKYSPSEVIAIVRVPELSRSPSSPAVKHAGGNEREDEQQQRAKLHYQRVHAASYRPPQPSSTGDYMQRQGRSRLGPHETPSEYPTPLAPHPRSSSYHSALHEHDRQQQQQDFDAPRSSPSSSTTSRRQVQRRSGSLGNLLGSNIEFEIEIEKRPPQHPEQPTIVALDQPTRAIVTTSRDGRVSIQNIAARPGNTVVINSDFHSSDRSLNRSSGYFSSDELRSQGITANYSSDELSSALGAHAPHSQSTHPRRYRNNNEPSISRLPSHYRPRPSNSQQLNNENFDQVNQLVHRYQRQGNGAPGFNDTIDQIDALYNNLNIQSTDYPSQQENNHSPSTYDFSKTSSTLNRRKNHSQNPTEYSKRYSSTGFQHMQSQYDPQTTPNSTLRHLVSPPIVPTTDTRRHRDAHRAFSDNENLNPNDHQQQRTWGSSSLNDLVAATPIRPSQSLSSSGILADYGTPGSISPNSAFGSTHNVILQQNRLNSQQQIVQRNRTSIKQMKQKSAAKKKPGNTQGQYSDEEDDHDSAGGHDSPVSDSGRPQPPARFSTRHQ